MRLIDADALKESMKPSTEAMFMYCNDDNKGIWETECEEIDAQPTIDPYKHGQWHRGRKKYWYYSCSECRLETPWQSPFCPQCGAQMEKMDPEEDKEKARARARAQRTSDDVLEEIRI